MAELLAPPRDPDIVMLQETNVKPKQEQRLRFPPGWVAVFSKQPYRNERGKGAAILVRCSILPPRGLLKVVFDVSNEFLDALAVNIRGYVFVSVYLHSNVKGPRGKRYEALHEALSPLNHLAGPVVLAGDFNYPRDSGDLCDTLSALGFDAVCDPHAATHTRGGKLDWVFLRACRERPRVLIRRQEQDHHQLHFVLRQGLLLPPAKPVPKYSRLLKLSLWEANLFHHGLAELLSDLAYQHQTSHALTYMRDTIPKYCAGKLGVRQQLRRPPKAWWNRAIEQRRRRVTRAQRAHKRSQSPRSLDRLHQAIKDYKREIKRSKTRAHRDAVDKINRGLASIDVLKRAKTAGAHQRRTVRDGAEQTFLGAWTAVFADPHPLPPPPRPPFDGPGLCDDASLPDTASPTTAGQGPSDPAQPDPPGPSYSKLQAALHKVSESLFTEDDVKAAVRSLKNKAPGEDGIPITVFKGSFGCSENGIDDEVLQAVDLYADTLAFAYNNAIQIGLPDWTKHGIARWLYKNKGVKDDPDNYRLIVLQPILMKILERMVDLRLRQLIDRGEIKVSVEQGGFMTYRSTYDSIFLLQSLHDGAKQHSEPLYTAFLDVKKAFDSVSHRKLLRVLLSQGVPQAWVGLVHELLVDRCTFLGDMPVPIQRGTPQGSPLSPLLFILFMEPLIERLRAGSEGVELCAGKEFIRCLLFADDICLTASSLEDLQRMLDICSQWATDMAMAFNTRKSHLLHLNGTRPDTNVVLLLSGQPLEWTQEVTYLGVALKRSRLPTTRLPLELPRAWASLYKAGAALSPVVPVPLAAQLRLIVTDVLAGVMYPAAVQDLDYMRIDTFVMSLIRRLTGCAAGSSATLLRCELGVMPSRYLAHRRAVQYWLHVSHDAWFAPLLPTFRGRGPLKRLQNIAALYDLTETTGISDGEPCPFDKDTWRNKVHEAVGDAAVRYLQEQTAQRGLSGPEVAPRRNGLLKLVARPYVREGGSLAKYGVLFRQCFLTTRFGDWDVRHHRPCPHCSSPGHFADPCHLLECVEAPPDLASVRSAVLGRILALEVREDPATLLSNMLLGKTNKVPALRLLGSLGSARPWVAGFTRWAKLEVTFCDALALIKKAVKQAKADAV
jgi:endonuclease/exonuclease/phosphatase family metal-dependent hydrolase